MSYTAGPFLARHLYLQWGGKLPSGEQWSCGVRMIRGTGVERDPFSMLTAATNAVKAMHQDANLQIGAGAKLSSVKLNVILPSGHYEGDGSNVAILADLPGGGPATQKYPNQIALCVSLLTGFSRGSAHRGRFYLPLPCYTLDSAGLISAGSVDVAKPVIATFVGALNAIHESWVVGVCSRKAGAPAERAVLDWKIGRVYDTQRRRRKSMLEAYV